MEKETCPCGLCGKPTRMLGTKRCDGCWELEGRVRRDPELAKRILDALGKVEPVGWKLAPLEPTDEMLNAGRKAIHDSHSALKKALLVYQAMLAAAPSQSQGENHVG